MADQEKVQATIKQLVRDWSVEGIEERTACYQPIIDEILNQFPLEYWYETFKFYEHTNANEIFSIKVFVDIYNNYCVTLKHSSEKYEMIGKFPVHHQKCKY